MKQNSFNDYLQKNLNEAQQKAVFYDEGPLLVIAGAGSGKTRIITARITHLILNKNVSPYTIAALTFTNKAANEMKDRIAHFLHSQQTLPYVGTFHAFCVQILKQNQHLLQVPFFTIIDQDDQEKMIKGILRQRNLEKQYSATNILYAISQMKNATVDPNNPNLELLGHPIIQDVYRLYEQEKLYSKCYDFNDILLETVRLFKTEAQFKTNFQKRFRHILVDEYQDTNIVQHEFLKQMALEKDTVAIDSVCAVGDEDQSIYSWRGATVENMLRFTSDFKNTHIIKVEQNYRCVKSVLDIANAVIKNNTQRTPKTLQATKLAQNRVLGLSIVSNYQEANTIVDAIKIIKKKKQSESIAILYRAHAQSRSLEEALIKSSTPYKIIGGVQFYERKEIKDLLAYLRLAANPFDRISFFRIINTPTRGLGAKFEEQVYNYWQEEPFLTFFEILDRCVIAGIITKSKLAALENFKSIFTDLSSTTVASKALEQIISRSNYLRYIKDTHEQDAQSRIENIQELHDAIKHFASEGTVSIEQFLHEVMLLQDKLAHQKESSDAILLMTLHAAKGLEFDTVFLPGLEDGIIPTQRAIREINGIEEERRLFYVGITRAKERLIITYAKNRFSYGQMVSQLPSRFLHEIPQELLEFYDCTYWNSYQFSQEFTLWLEGKTLRVPVKTKIDPIEKIVIKNNEEPLTFGTIKSVWKINQPVKHKKYGIGLIKNIEVKNSETTFLTISFNGEQKKISSLFVEKI